MNPGVVDIEEGTGRIFNMTKIKFQLREMTTIVICLTGTATISAQEETGVVINGVMWATRNVDSVGIFAENSGSLGMSYQWNRKKPCYVKGKVTDWDAIATWEAVNDPCPDGWRVPTRTEIGKLLDTTKVEYKWTTESGVKGGRFADKPQARAFFYQLPIDKSLQMIHFTTDTIGVVLMPMVLMRIIFTSVNLV